MISPLSDIKKDQGLIFLSRLQNSTTYRNKDIHAEFGCGTNPYN